MIVRSDISYVEPLVRLSSRTVKVRDRDRLIIFLADCTELTAATMDSFNPEVGIGKD